MCVNAVRMNTDVPTPNGTNGMTHKFMIWRKEDRSISLKTIYNGDSNNDYINNNGVDIRYSWTWTGSAFNLDVSKGTFT